MGYRAGRSRLFEKILHERGGYWPIAVGLTIDRSGSNAFFAGGRTFAPLGRFPYARAFLFAFVHFRWPVGHSVTLGRLHFRVLVHAVDSSRTATLLIARSRALAPLGVRPFRTLFHVTEFVLTGHLFEFAVRVVHYLRLIEYAKVLAVAHASSTRLGTLLLEYQNVLKLFIYLFIVVVVVVPRSNMKTAICSSRHRILPFPFWARVYFDTLRRLPVHLLPCCNIEISISCTHSHTNTFI